MPIIITAHMANTNANSIALHGRVRRRHESHVGRDHTEPGHVHAAHVHVGCEPEHVALRQRDDRPECAGNHQAISPEPRHEMHHT
jgi:hypothetical protein